MEPELPQWFTPATIDIVSGFLEKSPKSRLGNLGSSAENSVLEIKCHAFFRDVLIDWDLLLNKSHPLPFEMKDTNLRATPKALQRVLTPQTNQIDYFSQTIDYMSMSIKLRLSWALSREDQSGRGVAERVPLSSPRARSNMRTVLRNGCASTRCRLLTPCVCYACVHQPILRCGSTSPPV